MPPMLDAAAADRLAAERLSPGRLAHTRHVAVTAAELARRYGAPPAAAELAGLLHDICREWPADRLLAAAARHGIEVGPVERRRPVGLLHGPVAAAELAGRVSPEVAGAIAVHTVGAAGMSVLDKCLYLADFIEPGRDFDGLEEVRSLARTSLDAAVAAAARLSILDLVGRGRGVVPAVLALYNEWHASA